MRQVTLQHLAQMCDVITERVAEMADKLRSQGGALGLHTKHLLDSREGTALL